MRGACGVSLAVDATEIKHNTQLAAPDIFLEKWISMEIPLYF